jgi:hypothetical protein
MRAALAHIGISLMLASCVTITDRTAEAGGPQAAQTHQIRGAVSGQKQVIVSFYATAPDCTSLGYPTLKLAKPPQHGQVSIEKGTAFAAFGKDDPRSVCNGKAVPATVIYYTSQPGFIGADSVDFERIGVAGAYGYHAYTINVR